VIIVLIIDDFYQLQLWTLEGLSILAVQSDIFPFYTALRTKKPIELSAETKRSM
jgi:hypothetical protein